jgi:hypothetical protein
LCGGGVKGFPLFSEEVVVVEQRLESKKSVLSVCEELFGSEFCSMLLFLIAAASALDPSVVFWHQVLQFLGGSSIEQRGTVD